MRNVDIPFEFSKTEKERIKVKLEEYVQEKIRDELQAQLFCHAMGCIDCSNDRAEQCKTRNWLIGYMDAFKEEMIK